MSRTFDANPYYSPEKCGLILVGVLEDPDASYDFSTVIVAKDVETGKLYAAHDSGCSCPTPFESINSLDAMTQIASLSDLDRFIADVPYTRYEYNDRVKLLDAVRDELTST